MKKEMELIIAIVNSGYADDAMKAARSAGARGGTILNEAPAWRLRIAFMASPSNRKKKWCCWWWKKSTKPPS